LPVLLEVLGTFPDAIGEKYAGFLLGFPEFKVPATGKAADMRLRSSKYFQELRCVFFAERQFDKTLDHGVPVV
jgi:hypothetical protein